MIRIRPLIMLATIGLLWGCSGQAGKIEKNTGKDSLDQAIRESVETFKNEPIHKALTEQIIDKIPDDNLVQVIFENLAEKLPADYEKEYETVMSWNKSQQAIYMIALLEAEVNNGGYNQFYFNSSGQFYKHLPGALTLIGARKFAGLTQKANETYEKEKAKITKQQDGTVEGFSKSYENNPLNELDDKFYALYKAENLQQMQVNYIRAHKPDFIDK